MKITCGKCGAIANDADAHIRFHLYNLEGKPLFSQVAVKDGNVSLLVGKGFQPFEDSVFIDPQEYDLDCEEPGFSRLQNELIQVVTSQKGTLKDGLHSLPEDISDYPAVAQALETYVRIHFPNHWEGD